MGGAFPAEGHLYSSAVAVAFAQPVRERAAELRATESDAETDQVTAEASVSAPREAEPSARLTSAADDPHLRG